MREGQRIDMATHPLVKHYGLGGRGTVTAIKLTDPVNKRHLVIVRVGSTVLHVKDCVLPTPRKRK